MAGVQQVSFTSPYAADEQEVARRQRLAEALQMQAQQPLDTQMLGRVAIPLSPWQGAAKLAQALSSNLNSQDAQKRQTDLGERYRGDRSADMQALMGALAGTPERAAIPAPADELGGGPAAPAQAAAPGRIPAELVAALKTPEAQQQAMGLYMQQAARENAPPKWEKTEIRQPDGSVKRGYVNINSPSPEATFRPLGTEPVKQEFIAGQPVNPYTRTDPVADPNALMIPDGKGGFKPNDPLVGIKKDIASKGAANVNVKTDVKTGESLAGQVGPMMRDSTAVAEGAVKQVDAARRIVQAVDTGKIITGPTADARLMVTQLGQALGVGGKDEAEKITNTRAALRGLAELTLQGRQQMKGQGAITESEGKLAEKAMSGEISFTAAEIRQLAKASERAARFNYAEHERKLKVMQKTDALQGIAPFYQGPAMPPEDGAAVPQVSPETQKLLDRYAPKQR